LKKENRSPKLLFFLYKFSENKNYYRKEFQKNLGSPKPSNFFFKKNKNKKNLEVGLNKYRLI
jgi:hypothetical protein